VDRAYTKVSSAWLKGATFSHSAQSRLRDAVQKRDGSHGSPYWVQARSGIGEEDETMAIHENGQRLASDGVPLEKKRLGNWRIIEYRVLPERRAQSFEQVFRFDKEAKPSL